MLVYAGRKTASDALLLTIGHFVDSRTSDDTFRLCTTLPTFHKDNKP